MHHHILLQCVTNTGSSGLTITNQTENMWDLTNSWWSYLSFSAPSDWDHLLLFSEHSGEFGTSQHHHFPEILCSVMPKNRNTFFLFFFCNNHHTFGKGYVSVTKTKKKDPMPNITLKYDLCLTSPIKMCNILYLLACIKINEDLCWRGC